MFTYKPVLLLKSKIFMVKSIKSINTVVVLLKDTADSTAILTNLQGKKCCRRDKIENSCLFERGRKVLMKNKEIISRA